MQRRQHGIRQIFKQRHLFFALYTLRLCNLDARWFNAHRLMNFKLAARLFDHLFTFDHRLLANTAVLPLLPAPHHEVKSEFQTRADFLDNGQPRNAREQCEPRRERNQ